MNGASEKLSHLRRTMAQIMPERDHRLAPLGHAAADAALGGGLRLAMLHEVYARTHADSAAATGFAAGLTARVNETGARWLLWIRQDFSALEHGELHAAGLAELGLDPARVLMLKVADVADALRATGDALACRGLSAVVIETIGETKLLDLTASRRMTLAASERGVTPILLRLGAEPDASAAETRWIVHAGASPPFNEQGGDDWGAPVFAVELARNRHGMCGEWVMEWRGDERTFREYESGAAHSGAVAAAAFDRQDRTPTWRHAI
jgi:protein ImuA